jgi:hypothetical protein
MTTKDKKDKAERVRILFGLAAEVAFAVLPLLVVLMVLIHSRRSAHLFASPEWSFGTAILFGQALMKFISGLARGGEAATGPVRLIVALVVVFGLAPSLMVLTMTLQSSEAQIDPAIWLQIAQVLLFLAAAIMYLLLGTIGEAWSKNRVTP